VVSLFRIEDYVLDVFKPFMDNILGVYLHGSHARGDPAPDSDINVLVVCEKDINYQRKPGLNAEIVLLENLSGYANDSPIDYYCFINEALPLADNGLLEKMREYTLCEDKIKKVCCDADRSLKMLDNLVTEGDYAAAVYSLIYRLRSLYVVHAHIRRYTHKGFSVFLAGRGIKNEDFMRLYKIYCYKRDDKTVMNQPTMDDVDMLRSTSEKIIKEIRCIYPKIALAPLIIP